MLTWPSECFESDGGENLWIVFLKQITTFSMSHHFNTGQEASKVKKNEEKWRKVTTKQRFLSTCHLRCLVHTQMAHGKKSCFCSHFSPLFSTMLKSAEKWKNMKKSEETWKKVQKNEENKEQWRNRRKVKKMKKNEKKWRKVKQNEKNWRNHEENEQTWRKTKKIEEK